MLKEYFYDLEGYNVKIFLMIYNLAINYGLQKFLYFVSSLFFFLNFTVYYFIFVIFFIYKLKKLNNKTQFFDENIGKFFEVGIVYSLFIIFYAGLKYSVNLPRPFCSGDFINLISLVDFSKERCLSSFPSAHSGMAFVIAYYMWNYFSLRLAAILVVFLVGFARIGLAMHYPADVAYGYLIAFLVIYFGKKINFSIFYPFVKYILRLMKIL